MTRRRSWKMREQQVAEFFHTERTPLSGVGSKHTASDTLHERLFIEVKLREKHSAVTLWDGAKKDANSEGKIPVVALCEKNRPGFWIMCHSSVLKDVAKEAKDE